MTGKPGGDPQVLDLTPEERASGRLSEAGRHKALIAMQRSGFLQINDVLPREFAAALHRAYSERYSAADESGLTHTWLRVGDKRYMITVDLAAPFSDPRLYANPFFFPVVNDLLGQAAVLSSFGAVCALPGAAAQHIHVDHPPLFEETNLAPLLPCHAVTVVLPLVDLDAAAGATAVWPGSHREASPIAPTERTQDAAFVPETRLGSMYMMDYRLVHGGTANRSQHPRPILYAVYTRPWFSDASNFLTQPGLRMSSEDLAAVPEAFRTLFLHRQSSR